MILIVGAGLAGLSTAFHLSDMPHRLYERESEVGGLCRSYRKDGFTFDYTGHLLHFRQPDIKALVERLLAGKLLAGEPYFSQNLLLAIEEDTSDKYRMMLKRLSRREVQVFRKLATGTSTKAWEFVKNYTKTNAWNPKNVVVVNQRAFAGLPKNVQDGVVKAAAAAEPRGWEMSKAREKEGDETLAKNGVAVAEASAELKAALGKIGDQMAAEWQKSAGADGQAILKAYKGK